jgi:DNA-binding MarR family transcriptional regulator
MRSNEQERRRAARYCERCGAGVGLAANYCGSCGVRVAGPKTAVQGNYTPTPVKNGDGRIRDDTTVSQRNLSRLVTLTRLVRGHGETISFTTMQAFLAVAQKEGASQVDIMTMTGLPQTTLSRQLLDLGKHKRGGKPGLELVDWAIDPTELRRKRYTLTLKGKNLLTDMNRIMEG